MIDEAALQVGRLQVLGRLPDSSNNALLCSLAGDPPVRVVYKPQAGERPLWDFPSGTLSRRERAAALLDSVLGFDQVPQTAWREDGPGGPGIVQEWVEGRVDLALFPVGEVPEGWVGVVDAETRDGPVVVSHRADLATARMAVFDVIANNADRKGGHLLRTPDGLFGIDHGVTFHEEPKLRTVLWGFVGSPIPEELLQAVASADLGQLRPWLSEAEVAATRARADDLLRTAIFPPPTGTWPALPWPLI
jgi:uncharacterized repeat protein (TIGR03843 family)